MENGKKRISLYDIVAIGLMAAFVFIATFFFKIKIPTPGGSNHGQAGQRHLPAVRHAAGAVGAAAWRRASAARCST